MNTSTFYGPRKARQKTTACDIPSGSEDSDLSDSDDDYPPESGQKKQMEQLKLHAKKEVEMRFGQSIRTVCSKMQLGSRYALRQTEELILQGTLQSTEQLPH
ncbi:hypothetical protein HPB50_011523 [Hyalomma asiaticum]|uniref:Uncharacterized protein n=1 Tax=Hyalomma asiaticum TaxID=266040 RepID=A0ACB7T753_HYAAI|nr:hypothetical protein HPB50_011523 [Hyalomma asiaticum]